MFSKVKHYILVVNYGQMFYNIGPVLNGLICKAFLLS